MRLTALVLALLGTPLGVSPVGATPVHSQVVRKTVLIVELDNYYTNSGRSFSGLIVTAEGLAHACLYPKYNAVQLPGGIKPGQLNGERESLTCPNIGFSHIFGGYYFGKAFGSIIDYSEVRAHIGLTHHYLCTPEPTQATGTSNLKGGIVQWFRQRCLATIT